MRILSLLLILVTSLVFGLSFMQNKPFNPGPVTAITDTTKHVIDKGPSKKAALWADSVMKTLTTDEKIGQLFMIPAYSNLDSTHQQDILRYIENYHVGGLIFFQGGPVRQARLTNLYQQQTKIPLMIGMDAEWGMSMRLDSCVRYPKQMALGAIQNDSLIEKMGESIGKECRRLGVHVNFAPVADINNNSANPVIGIRSFGERKKMVANRALLYFKGMNKAKVMACAKHFPGHGDTETDSHLGLPLLQHSQERLDTLEFYPFKKLIAAGIPSIMVGHMNIPALDTSKEVSSVFSHIIINEWLIKKMGYKGLIFTDALNMQGAATRYAPGEIELRSILAGNDVLLCPTQLDTAFATVKAAVADGFISKERLDQSVKKILMAKYHFGLSKKQRVKEEDLFEDLNAPKNRALAKVLTEKSMTLLKNNKNILPLKKLDTLNMAVISIGDSTYNTFIKSTERYAPAKRIALGRLYNGNINDSLENIDLVIIGLHYSAHFPQRNFMITDEMMQTLQQLQDHKHILVIMGNAYQLDKLNTGKEDALLLTYENTVNAQDIAGMVIFGGATATGKLPVTLNSTYTYGKAVELKQTTRFKYVIPEEIGISSNDLVRVDSIANYGISEGAYPGCVVLAAKDGKVFYQKAFGHHTFDKTRPVQVTDIYDLASVSKISGTVMSLMKLTDQKKFNVDDKLGKYLPDELDSSVYAKTVIRQMLTHQAGFVDWIPFFLKVVKKGVYDPKVFKTKPQPGYTTRIHDNLYILDTYEDSIFKTIKKTPLRGSFGYKYSDLGYYFLKRVIYKKTGKPLNQYAFETFYKPLGLQTMGYLPRERFSLDRIPPTEDDKTFRYALVHGDVHDQGAAMVGGVGGHAGLFADANDVGVLFQMMMNYGTYGGERYINEATLKEWTKCQFCPKNRRGIGFDRPTMSGKGPTCNCVSSKSFGHTGFTGITAWADPESKIVYVFLSNRSNPVADNPKIISLGIRTRIQQVIVDAVNHAGKTIQ